MDASRYSLTFFTLSDIPYLLVVQRVACIFAQKDERFNHSNNYMGYFVGIPLGGTNEKDYQAHFGKNMEYQIEVRTPLLPAEWGLQSGVQLTWPHQDTDWAEMLDEVEHCFMNIAREIACRQHLLIVHPRPDEIRGKLEKAKMPMENIRLIACDTNDTWARDHGAITMLDTDGAHLLDFMFNGWGLKFAADKDNLITRHLVTKAHVLKGQYVNRLGFVLEGGSIESDGRGTLLTTSHCLLSPNRNGQMNRIEIEEYLRSTFSLERVLWLEHGYLAGDDTDSHIDTLARFCNADTIAYVQCTDSSDEHYEELKLMEDELKAFRTLDGRPYRLLPLPLPDPIADEGQRLPATYANFLILNDAVLYPTYRQDKKDKEAGCILQEAFPGRDIIGIDCCPLIRQHGSLHCVTMQYPAGVM